MTILYIFAAILLTKVIWSAYVRISYRRQIDRIIARGEGPPEQIELYIAILRRDPAPSKRDLRRLERLRSIRSDMRRGVKHIKSRVIDPPNQ